MSNRRHAGRVACLSYLFAAHACDTRVTGHVIAGNWRAPGWDCRLPDGSKSVNPAWDLRCCPSSLNV